MKLGVLSELAADVSAPARMPVYDPDSQRVLTDEDGNECYLELYSMDSEVGRKLERDRGFAQMRKMRSGRNQQDDDDPIEQQIETVVALSAGWFFGKDADQFSKNAAQSLFADGQYRWLLKQAWTFVYSAANFIKHSSKASSASASINSATPEG